jgi:membrane protease YdiL (CAAX protease family)
VLLILPGFVLGAESIQRIFIALTDIKPPETARALNGVFRPFPWLLTVLAVAIGPGVVEELWCRGLFGRILTPRIGIIAGVCVTAFLFSAMHMDHSQFLVYALMGIYLHFIYLASRSIWVPILLHAGNNAMAILLTLTLSQEALSRDMPVVVAIGALSLLLFGSVALWTSRALEVPVLRENDAWYESDGWKPEYPGISAPPPEANVKLDYAIASPVAAMFTLISFAVLLYLSYRFVI